MLKTLFLATFIAAVGFVAYKWANGPGGLVGVRVSNTNKPEIDPEITDPEPGSSQTPRHAPQVTRTALLPFVPGVDNRRFRDPLLIPDARLGLIDFPELAAQRTGKVLFLGRRVPQAEVRSDAEMRKVARDMTRSFLAIETTQAELTQMRAEGKQVDAYTIPNKTNPWREWLPNNNDPLDPAKVDVIRVREWYYPLREGKEVFEGELLGMIDPQLTEAELYIKLAKLSANEAEVRAAYKTKEEAKVRYDRGVLLLRTGAIGKEEVDGFKLTWERYIEEEAGKRAMVEVAKKEIAQTVTVMKQHEIRASLTGTVRKLHKQPDESIKEQEPIMRIDSLEQLQIEALVGEQHRRKLAATKEVLVEAVRREEPSDKLRAHREALTAVAVGQAKNKEGALDRLIFSASEDRTICVWKVEREGTQWAGRRLHAPVMLGAVVKSLSCTTPKAGRNLGMAGLSDGTALLWDLDRLETSKPIMLDQRHKGAVQATAFSADGKQCATAGEDKTIHLWTLEKNEADGALTATQAGAIPDAHKGTITSLAFTPEGLISAGRDNRMVIWPIKDGKFDGTGREVDQRGGSVEELGVVTLPGAGPKDPPQVSVLYDQGNQLRILDPSVAWSTRDVVQNPGSGGAFTNFALFSPNGKMILTAGQADNRLQLWSNPVLHPKGRAMELRQYIWKDGAATCAAFDPDSQFVVTGTRDRQVMIWALPSEEELNEPPVLGKVRAVGQVLDAGSRQIRVLVDVQRKNSSLLPGDTATLVIDPK